MTPAPYRQITAKLKRLNRHFYESASVLVVLPFATARCMVEETISTKGTRLHASAETKDMYTVFDSIAIKPDHQVLKHKNKVSGHQNDENAPNTGGEA